MDTINTHPPKRPRLSWNLQSWATVIPTFALGQNINLFISYSTNAFSINYPRLRAYKLALLESQLENNLAQVESQLENKNAVPDHDVQKNTPSSRDHNVRNKTPAELRHDIQKKAPTELRHSFLIELLAITMGIFAALYYDTAVTSAGILETWGSWKKWGVLILFFYLVVYILGLMSFMAV